MHLSTSVITPKSNSFNPVTITIPDTHQRLKVFSIVQVNATFRKIHKDRVESVEDIAKCQICRAARLKRESKDTLERRSSGY
jgi:hypothetical protein